MVEDDQEHARRAVCFLQCLQDFRCGRRGKNIAYDADIQHALAHESAQGRLVSRPAKSNQCNLVCRLWPGTDHKLARFELYFVGICKGKSFQQFGSEIGRIIYELFMSMDIPPSFSGREST